MFSSLSAFYTGREWEKFLKVLEYEKINEEKGVLF